MLKHVGIKVFASFAVFIFVLSIFGTTQAASSLKDIPRSSANEINFLINKGVIKGYSDGYFRPTKSVTRGEAAIMLGIALGLDGTKRSTSFTDVGLGNGASGYIQSAVDAQIISGYSDSTYRPQNPITRGEMAYLLQRGFKLSEKSSVYFSDIAKSGPQYEAINTIATAGLTVGYSDGTFQPSANVTRQEFAVFVARGLNTAFRVQAPTAPTTPTTPTTPAAANTYGTVKADLLNVRTGPGASYSRIGSLAQGTVVTILGSEGNWSKINYNNQQGYVNKGYLIISNSSTGGLLQGKIIVVDPGHGGSDPGASSVSGTVEEKDIALKVANLVAGKLRGDGANVVMTRTGDTYPTLGERVNISGNANGELFVSIHANAINKDNPRIEEITGTETIYNDHSNASGDESYELALEIQKQIIALVGMKDRGARNDYDYYRGVELKVLRDQDIPSVLVEMGFITNSGDLAKLTSAEYQELFAEAIFRGIKNYYSH